MGEEEMTKEQKASIEYCKNLQSWFLGLKAKRNRIARRGHRRGMPYRGSEFVEVVKSWKPPELNMGGYLEMHKGELCLRVADQMEYVRIEFVTTRTWKRGKFSPDIYEVKK